MSGLLGITPDSLEASGRSFEKLNLPNLQDKMKRDPQGYETEIQLIHKQFKASVDLFQQQAALSFSHLGSKSSVANDLGDRAMFLAHVTPFYPKQLSAFPAQLTDLLRTSCLAMPWRLRNHVAQALILLMNRKSLIIDEELLGLFLDIQTFGDKNLRNLAFSHIVKTIRKMSITDRRHIALQQIVISMLEQEDEEKAKRALVTLCELHKRKVWIGEKNARVAIAICEACFHTSSRIMISSLRILLDYDGDDYDDDSDPPSSDDEDSKKGQVAVNREVVYKANNQGTSSSKKKKQAKLLRALKSIKRKQRSSSENTASVYSPLNHLNDPQDFAEKLFSRLKSNEQFETKLMMIKVIARTIGLHKLQLLSFYPYHEKYAEPKRRDITQILAAAVEACHDGIPSDDVEQLFKTIVNKFVHDRAHPEVIAFGLNVIREMCVRIPELMTEDLLHDLALYKKSHDKAISAAARALIALFREINPSLLVRKDRGRVSQYNMFILLDGGVCRPGGPVTKPKQYGEVDVFSNVPNVELLQSDHETESDEEDDDGGTEDEAEEEYDEGDDMNNTEYDSDIDTLIGSDEEEEMYDSDEAETDSENEEVESDEEASDSAEEGSGNKENAKGKKRKIVDFDANLLSADTSLRAVKRIAESKSDDILSNEDFRTIKELQAKKGTKTALARKEFKVPDSDQLSRKGVDVAKLEVHKRHKLIKEQRLELVKAGREDRGKYRAKAAVKKKKTGGSSNEQKEHRRNMPLAAIRSKVGKSKRAKMKKDRLSGSQFRGRKAWK